MRPNTTMNMLSLSIQSSSPMLCGLRSLALIRGSAFSYQISNVAYNVKGLRLLKSKFSSSISSSVHIDSGTYHYTGYQSRLSGFSEGSFIECELCQFVDIRILVGNGGAIFVSSSSSTSFISDSFFVNCSTTVGGGGAIYFSGAESTVINSCFDGCSSVLGGGAIWSEVSASYNHVNKSTAQKCLGASVAYLYNGYCLATKLNSTSNLVTVCHGYHATTSYGHHACHITIASNYYGAALLVSGTAVSREFKEISVFNNTAGAGSSLITANGNNLISDSRFSKNSFSHFVYPYDGTVTFSDCQIDIAYSPAVSEYNGDAKQFGISNVATKNIIFLDEWSCVTTGTLLPVWAWVLIGVVIAVAAIPLTVTIKRKCCHGGYEPVK